MAREYIDTIAWLYSDLVQNRGCRIKDFYDLTMPTVNEELKLQTQIIKNDTERRLVLREKKKEQDVEKEKQKQKEMMEKLKILNAL